MLKTLTEINAVSGNEDLLADFIIKKIKPYATDIKIDSMGNIIAFKKGRKGGKLTHMFAAHTDEVGFIITKVCDNGFLKFEEVGGISDQILLTQRVEIGENRVSGILGVKAVHLQSKDERESLIKKKNMYIDIGAKDKADAEKRVKIGDYATFCSKYTEFGNDKIKAKALDDRVGVYTLMQLIKHEYDADIYFCFTVQEEVGLRGAKIVSHRLNADTCLVFEGTNAADVDGVEPHKQVTALGGGPALSIMDRASISNKKYNEFIENIAKNEGFKYQYKRTVMGGNDAGSIATAADGCATAVISLPTRYIHSPISVAKKSDVDDMVRLARGVAENLHKFDLNMKERL